MSIVIDIDNEFICFCSFLQEWSKDCNCALVLLESWLMYATSVTLGVFGLILVLVRFKVPLSIALFASSITAGLFFKMGIVDIGTTLLSGATQLRTIGLIILTMQIVSLSSIMNTTGIMDRIVDLAKKVLRRPAITMAVLPALIGLLPMPGGALFSAPMVKSAAGNAQIKGPEMSAINYWYRHIWELWWPLYPGVMLAMTLTAIPFEKFIVYQLPLGIFMTLSGLLLFRKSHPDIRAKSESASLKAKRQFLMTLSPIWILLIVWIPLNFTIGKLVPADSEGEVVMALKRYLPLTIGLFVSIGWVCVLKKVKLSALGKIVARKSTWKLEAVVIGVMVFQFMLGQTDAARQIAEELRTMNVPIVLVVAILPVIAGIVTGLAIGFVGTSFPIVLALISNEPVIFPYVALAYGCGHLGMMLSPIHICHIVTNEYFDSNYSKSYGRMWPVFAVNFTLIGGYFALLKYTI